MINALSAMPAGQATETTTHDPYPGAPDGIPVTATVSFMPDEARVEIDLRDNPDSFPCGLNLSEACARTAAMIGLFNSLPAPIPTNAGSFRRITTLLRPGCVVGIPEHPTSTSVATTNVADRVTAAVQLAIAKLGFGHGLAEAGGFGAPSAAVISGRDSRADARPFVNQLFLVLSGGPGNPHQDGWLTFCHAGNGGMLYVDSVELDELMFPILIRTQRVEPDTEGAGRRRGAPSVRVEYGPLADDLTVIYAGDGHVNAAKGAAGGLAGSTAEQYRRDLDGVLHPLAGWGEIVLAPGEAIVCKTAAGGGYGSPFEREVELVARDVREGWITPARARSVYKVAVDATGALDRAETARLRANAGLEERGEP
jgi:N-methylhydantoinase B